jgi:hypothetical protein
MILLNDREMLVCGLRFKLRNKDDSWQEWRGGRGDHTHLYFRPKAKKRRWLTKDPTATVHSDALLSGETPEEVLAKARAKVLQIAARHIKNAARWYGVEEKTR